MIGENEILRSLDIVELRRRFMTISEDIRVDMLLHYDCILKYVDENSINVVGRERMQFNTFDRILTEIRLYENKLPCKPVEHFNPC